MAGNCGGIDLRLEASSRQREDNRNNRRKEPMTKTRSKKVVIKWLDNPEKQDYPAALSYLSLIYDGKKAANYVKRLKGAPAALFKAKDIFRASDLPLLGVSNSHVKQDQKKIESGAKLSPLLLVRDSANGKVVIADGYHRLCAIYFYDEDAIIRCRIV